MIFGRLCRCFAVLILSLDEILKVQLIVRFQYNMVCYYWNCYSFRIHICIPVFTSGVLILVLQDSLLSCLLRSGECLNSLGFGNKLFPYLTDSLLIDIGVPIVNQIQDVVDFP